MMSLLSRSLKGVASLFYWGAEVPSVEACFGIHASNTHKTTLLHLRLIGTGSSMGKHRGERCECNPAKSAKGVING